jgi:hypothetical protein
MPPEASKEAAKQVPAPDASRVTMSELKSDAPDTYTVVKGDTLWGIAGRFLKDPWKWPEIWNMNKDQIKNPHLIYPGDVIRLDRSGQYPSLSLSSGSGADEAAANVVKLDPRVRVEPLRTAIPSIPASAIAPFLTQPLVVEVGGLDAAPAIVGNEEARVVVGAGDVTYADRIASTDVVNWQVFRPGAVLKDPDSGEVLGYEAKYIADARVRRFGIPTTLEITKAREEVNRGDKLLPARELAYPTYVPHSPDKPIRGSIMSVDGGVSELGQFQIVTINRGARDGVEIGHVLASYRRGLPLGTGRDQYGILKSSSSSWTWFSGEVKPVPVVPDPPRPASATTEVKTAPPTSEALILPDERNGLVFVFRVFEKMSYAMVMRASRPIYVGDIVKTP